MAEETTDVTDSAQIGASPDAGGSSPLQSSATPSGDSPGGVTTQPDPSQQTNEPADPLAGVPTLEELQGKENQPYAKAVAQLRGVYEPLKTQFDEVSTKFAPFELVSDRFQSADEVQEVVKLHDSLNKYSPDPVTGALTPDPSEFVADITTKDPERADYMAGQLMWSQVRNPQTGQPVSRAEMFLQMVASDPEMREFRGKALQILGGVEPSQVPAPTWTPTPEELDKVDPNLVSQYKKLSYEERDELKLSSPEYINAQLRTRQLNEQLIAEKTERETRDAQAYARQEQIVEQRANAAGDQYVEKGFKEGFTNFANHTYETYKPTDDPAVNKREGAQVNLAVVALSHPDTRFAAEEVLKELGLTQQDLDKFNEARESYAKSGREFAYLTHKRMRVTGEDPTRAWQRLNGQASSLRTKIITARDAYFKLAATKHNETLDQAATARALIGGTPQTAGNGSGNRYLQAGKRTEADIWGTS